MRASLHACSQARFQQRPRGVQQHLQQRGNLDCQLCAWFTWHAASQSVSAYGQSVSVTKHRFCLTSCHIPVNR